MSTCDVRIAGNLVRHLRRGVKREMSATLEVLAAQLEASLERDTYYDALARFDEARTLLDAVGVSNELEPADLELDLARWPRLVLNALESEYVTVLMRLKDTGAGLELPSCEIHALEILVAEIRERAAAPPRRTQSLLARVLARRHTGEEPE